MDRLALVTTPSSGVVFGGGPVTFLLLSLSLPTPPGWYGVPSSSDVDDMRISIPLGGGCGETRSRLAVPSLFSTGTLVARLVLADVELVLAGNFLYAPSPHLSFAPDVLGPPASGDVLCGGREGARAGLAAFCTPARWMSPTGNLTVSTDNTRGLLTVAVVGGFLVAAASPDLLAVVVVMLGAALFAAVLLRAVVEVVVLLIDGPAVTAAYEGDLLVDVVDSFLWAPASPAAVDGDGVVANGSVSCRDPTARRLSAPPTVSANRVVALAARLAVG